MVDNTPQEQLSKGPVQPTIEFKVVDGPRDGRIPYQAPPLS